MIFARCKRINSVPQIPRQPVGGKRKDKKMIKKFLLFTILLCALFSIGCEDRKSIQKSSESSKKAYFSIFLVKGSNTSEIDSTDLSKLQIEPKPYLTDRELVSYNWKNHTLILKQSKPSSQIVAMIGTRFIVVAENQCIFTGQFLSLAISSTRSTPVIIESNTELRILKGYPDDTYGKPGDPRKDSRIYQALKKAKILVE